MLHTSCFVSFGPERGHGRRMCVEHGLVSALRSTMFTGSLCTSPPTGCWSGCLPFSVSPSVGLAPPHARTHNHNRIHIDIHTRTFSSLVRLLPLPLAPPNQHPLLIVNGDSYDKVAACLQKAVDDVTGNAHPRPYALVIDGPRSVCWCVCVVFGVCVCVYVCLCLCACVHSREGTRTISGSDTCVCVCVCDFMPVPVRTVLALAW